MPGSLAAGAVIQRRHRPRPGRQRLLRALSRHLGALPPRRSDTTPTSPPRWFGCFLPPPQPSAVDQPDPAAASAPPGGSDARPRPVLPACRQWRPGRRSPERRSLPPPPGRAPRRPVSARGWAAGRGGGSSRWGGLCRGGGEPGALGERRRLPGPCPSAGGGRARGGASPA